jgi:retron-type reverse transcriptase
VPILKIGKKTKSDVESYRPISLACMPCRVMEKLIHLKLSSFLSSNNIISKAQHGFQSGKSTETQLLASLNIWTKGLNEKIKGELGFNVDVVYLDFKKAFDSVSHVKLLSVLEKMGISGQLLLWIKDFLSNRTQSVKINDSLSVEKPVLSGVPQGSLIGPILFNAYINDLPLILSNKTDIFLYADDAKLS